MSDRAPPPTPTSRPRHEAAATQSGPPPLGRSRPDDVVRLPLHAAASSPEERERQHRAVVDRRARLEVAQRPVLSRLAFANRAVVRARLPRAGRTSPKRARRRRLGSPVGVKSRCRPDRIAHGPPRPVPPRPRPDQQHAPLLPNGSGQRPLEEQRPGGRPRRTVTAPATSSPPRFGGGTNEGAHRASRADNPRLPRSTWLTSASTRPAGVKARPPFSPIAHQRGTHAAPRFHLPVTVSPETTSGPRRRQCREGAPAADVAPRSPAW